MKSLLTLTLLFFACFLAKADWQYTINNFTRGDYCAGNQNWMIRQHPNGWMYFANNKGLLEFDGVYWKNYSFDYVKMRSLAFGKENRIYSGGLGEFGFYEPNEKGELVYQNLSNLLPKEVKVGVIWDLHIDGETVYFVSNNEVYCWKDGAVSVFESVVTNTSQELVIKNQRITKSALFNGQLFLLISQGLVVFDGQTSRLLPGTSFFGQVKTVGILQVGEGLMFVTEHNGLFFFNEEGVVPYTGVTDQFIRENQLFCATVKDSLLVLGTVQNGVFVVDMKTHTTEHISIENGLQNKTVLNLFFDKESNLWLALDNGIDCIRIDSPVYSICKSREIGSGYSAFLKDDYVYLGTNQGLYMAPVENNKFTREYPLNILPVTGTEGQVWSIRELGGEILCNGDKGVFVLDKGQAERRLTAIATWSEVQIDEQTAIAGTYSGLYVMRKENGMWNYSHRVSGFTQSCKTLFMDDAANNLWVANSEYGIHRVKVAKDLATIENEKNYNTPDFPVKGNVCIARIDNDIVFTSGQGLFRYNRLDDLLEPFAGLEELLDGKSHYTYLKQDEDRNIWYCANGQLKLVRYNSEDDSYEKNRYDSYLSNALIEEFEDVFLYSEKEVLIGTEDGFSLINSGYRPQAETQLFVQIRRVYNTIADTLVYGRSFVDNSAKIVQPYGSFLRIEYGANSFDPLLHVQYSCRLSGDSHEEWTEYNSQTAKEYTHLREGKYTFEVRAITNVCPDPVMASVSFVIVPPWYRSTLAYFCYAVLVLLLAYYLWHQVKKSKRMLIMENQQILLQKELEFMRQTEIKDKKIDSLKEENLKAELTHKTQEVMSTALNLIRKNEILEEIKKDVVSMSRSIADDDMVAIRRKNLGLVNKINTNLEYDVDFQYFQNNFDALHHDFFKTLEEKHPALTRKEKVLCAYIHQNLLTKEIAPLLNMSVRGVEIMRYRVRKKLGLTEKDSLYEYLQRITHGSAD